MTAFNVYYFERKEAKHKVKESKHRVFLFLSHEI